MATISLPTSGVASAGEPPHRATGPPRDEEAHLAAIIATQAEIAAVGLDLVAVMDLVARRVQALTAADGASVGLAEGGEVVYRAASGIAAPHLGARLGIETSLSGRCVRSAEVLRCDDAEEDPRVDREACRRIGVRSMLIVPLPHGGRVVGMVKVFGCEARRFGDRDARTLQLMAGLVGAAMGHAAEFAAKRGLLAERTAALEALRESEERFRAFAENGPAVSFMKDAEGRYLYANALLERESGLGPAGLLGKTDFDWLPEAAARRARERDRAALAAGRAIEAVETVPTPGGAARDWLISRFPVKDRAGRTVLGGVGIDITERKALERRLAEQLRRAEGLNAELERRRREVEQANLLLSELATIDGLTGLKNVRHFREALEAAFSFAARHGQPLSMVLLDVDHFKRYNDTYGHPAGDEVLCAVAGALRGGLRDGDLAARYGGEEFVLLLPATDHRASLAVAGRVRASIAGLPWPRRPVTTSLGVATLTPETASPAEMIEQADRALYHSKQRGRDRATHFRELGDG